MSPDNPKAFRLTADEIDRSLAPGRGSCLASDLITVGGHKVGFAYREEAGDQWDSGWRFMAGIETQEFMDDAKNFEIYDVNTIANYDREIIAFLDAPVGSAFERDSATGKLIEVHDFEPPVE